MDRNLRIKVVEVIADSAMGGGPKHVLGILRHLDQSKFEPFLICPEGYLARSARRIPGVSVFLFNPRSKFDIKAIYDLDRLVHYIRSTKNPFGPIIVHSHGQRAGFMARILASFGVKKVYTEHVLTSDYHLRNWLNEWTQKYILKRQNHKSDLVIAVSSAVSKYIVKSKLAPRKRVVVVPNGIELTKEAVSSRIPFSNESKITIGTIGNLNRQKGHKYLIDALQIIRQKLPMVSLEIIGEGEERVALEERVKKLSLEDNIKFLGYQTDPVKYMRNWDAFVLPSLSETFGIVILEAMQAGLPVIATKVGGVIDIVENEKSGLLIEAGRADKIAEAFFELYQDHSMQRKLVERGKARVKDFDWKKQIKLLEEQYEGLFKD